MGIHSHHVPSGVIPFSQQGGNVYTIPTWQMRGINIIGQIFDGKMSPFQDLKEQFGVTESSFLTYAQISSIINKKCREGSNPASCPEWDLQLRKVTVSRGAVSNIYHLLATANCNAYSSVQSAWERDLGISLESSEWDRIWKSALYSSKCVRYKIIQYKILNRAYFTPVTMSKINDESSDTCWHGCGGRGTLLHLLW